MLWKDNSVKHLPTRQQQPEWATLPPFKSNLRQIIGIMARNAPWTDLVFESEHLNLPELKEKPEMINHGYLFNDDIPEHPENVEFHVSSVVHVTDKRGLDGILSKGGFMAGKKKGSFVWWSLHVTKSEIQEAQQRFLNREFPNMQAEDDLLSKFTTSPAFLEESRYGNFKFTFRLADLLQMYQDQICEGEEPILRVYQTVVFKQEIMYAVVVHSPTETQFDRHPLLQDVEEGAVCAYRGGEMIWHAQSLSNTCNYRLINNTDSVRATQAKPDNSFYVWDHVTLAFYVQPDQTFVVKKKELLHSLSACDMIQPYYENRDRLSLKQASQIVGDLKPIKN